MEITSPMKFRKKPVVIDAAQYDGTNSEAVIQTLEMEHGKDVVFTPSGGMVLRTLESKEFLVSVDDFVIKGVKGEFYACKPDIFAMTYEADRGAPRPEGGLRQMTFDEWVKNHHVRFERIELFAAKAAWEAALKYAVPLDETARIPQELFDGMAVYVELGTRTVQHHHVAIVLDAVVRLIRKRQQAQTAPQKERP